MLDTIPKNHPLRTLDDLVEGVLKHRLADLEQSATGWNFQVPWPAVFRGHLLVLSGWVADIRDLEDRLRFDEGTRSFVLLPDYVVHIPGDSWPSMLAELQQRPLFNVLWAEICRSSQFRRLLRDRRLHPDHRLIKKVHAEGKASMRRLRSSGKTWLRRLKRLVFLLVLLMSGAAGGFLWFAKDLPGNAEMRLILGKPSIEIVVNAQGVPSIVDAKPIMPMPILSDSLPDYIADMLLTSEDRYFYYHPGFDPAGLARAVYVFVANKLGMERRPQIGGSTLTQQLAKNVFLSQDKTWQRKVREIVLAVKLELMFTKQELLELYLANAYFGHNLHGIELASRRYFGVSAKSLTREQVAMLVSLLPSPHRYNPERNFDLSKRRATRLLKTMISRRPAEVSAYTAALRVLTDASSRQALHAGDKPSRRINYRWFTDWLIESLEARKNLKPGRWRVVLTMDPIVQIYAQIAVERYVARNRRKGVTEAAVVAIRPNGEIAAIVGGRNYSTSQYSKATTATRQPGSIFKPFVYLTALEQGFAGKSDIADEPFEGRWPMNFTGRYLGKTTLEIALADSLNGAAVNLSERVGRARVINTARRLGITGSLPDQPSLALGVGEATLLEMTNAYAAFANGGTPTKATGLLALRDDEGGLIVDDPYRTFKRKPFANSVIAELNRMMRGVIARGTGRAANLDGSMAGKTGTTQNHRDAWFIGYTGDIVVGVWVGDDQNRPMHSSVTGGSVPAEAWRNIMANLKADLYRQGFNRPPGL